MQPSFITKLQTFSSLFKTSLICTLAGTAMLMLVVNVIARIESLSTGAHIDSDPNGLIFVLVLLCLLLFIPVFLGVFLLSVLLRYELRKGRLTPKTGLLSGMGLWAFGGIVFCLLFIRFDPFPPDPSLRPHDLLGMLPLLFDDVYLPGIAVACLVGGWAGHVLAGQLLSARQAAPPQ